MFRALTIRNYRLWASGAIVSNTGTWMQRVAQDWLVLTQLTNNSGVAVGITTALQFAPVLLLAPWAGAVTDRFDRRKVLITTQVTSAVLGLTLGFLIISGLVELWMVYALAAGLGVVAAVDGPARQAFVSELVPVGYLPNAVGLNSASFNAGRLIGPGLAGLLIHWFGTGPVFVINGLSFIAVVFSLTRMNRAELGTQQRPARGNRSARAGLAYVRSHPEIALVMTVVGAVAMIGLNSQITIALMARLTFDKGAGEFGLLGSVMAIGSLGGALLAARRERPTVQLVLGAAAAFGITSILSAVMPTYETFALMLIPVGLAALTMLTAANATVQLATDPSMRGRVMALYMAILMGGTPIGSPIIGWIGEEFGARWTILIGGVGTLLAALVGMIWLSRSAKVREAVQRAAERPVGTVTATAGRAATTATPEATAVARKTADRANTVNETTENSAA
ncbi:MFS transporter [Kineosporia rhizophila]|uniref:MFS transporter n=1 Tax=Kineosporia TaxID=49184 RepID=UPI001E4C479F|nr:MULTISPECIES: MFS transporter [Kineosporia]MCE0540184.1 MFS transporter [Kineosporia rhizophila]